MTKTKYSSSFSSPKYCKTPILREHLIFATGQNREVMISRRLGAAKSLMPRRIKSREDKIRVKSQEKHGNSLKLSKKT